MRIHTVSGFVAALGLAFPAVAGADIVALKDGSVVECIVKETTIKKNQPVMVVELEDGSTMEISRSDVAWTADAQPSWIARKENLEWYGRESAKLEVKRARIKPSDHERIGRECRRRRLDEQADTHFTRAYELKAAEAGVTAAAHESIARWLERPCGLFELASAEWKRALDKRMEERGQEAGAADYCGVGQFAEQNALYDEAEELYTQALQIDPTHRQAEAGVERIRLLREALVNTKLFRTVRDETLAAVRYFENKDNSDGSYGADAKEGGVQGLRAMTALCALGAIAGWEFESVSRPEAGPKAPKNVEKAIKFLLDAPSDQKKLRGPDVWGNVWTLALFAKVLGLQQLQGHHERIKGKLAEIIAALQRQMSPNGGWMYYDFLASQPASFVTGVGILAMSELKGLGAEVPEPMVARCVELMKQLKQSDGVWMYRLGQRQAVEGCQGRASLCELALHAAGFGTTAAVQAAVENFFKYRHVLEKVKGLASAPIGTGGTAPYYYLFGHLWTARACRKLDADVRDAYAARLRDLFLKDQEPDGAFSDFPMLKETYKTYGSAMGALTLYYIGTLEKE